LPNSERFDHSEDPYPRVAELRATMNKFGLQETLIIMAGGVWYLRDWTGNEKGTTGQKADPRSFCSQKILLRSAHGDSPENNLMFSGHAAYKFGQDPFYNDGFIPTVKQLVDRIATSD